MIIKLFWRITCLFICLIYLAAPLLAQNQSIRSNGRTVQDGQADINTNSDFYDALDAANDVDYVLITAAGRPYQILDALKRDQSRIEADLRSMESNSYTAGAGALYKQCQQILVENAHYFLEASKSRSSEEQTDLLKKGNAALRRVKNLIEQAREMLGGIELQLSPTRARRGQRRQSGTPEILKARTWQNHKFISEEIDDELKNRLKEFDIPLETFKEALREVNRYGKDPTTVIPELMKNNRILSFGEGHFTLNPQRDFGATIMPKLKEAGATYLAIEAPIRIQPALKKYMSTGQLDPTVLPTLLRHRNYLNLLESARKNDIKIIAVDEEKYGIGNYFARPDKSPRQRNEIMAYNIDSILSKDPNSKIIFWVGAMHLIYKDSDPQSKSVTDLLKNKYSIATILPTYRHTLERYPLAELTSSLNQSVAIPSYRTPTIRGLPFTKKANVYLREWDYIMLFPNR